jgi:hypothetical protein
MNSPTSQFAYATLLTLGLGVSGAQAFVGGPNPAGPTGWSAATPVAMCGRSCRNGGRYIQGPPSVCEQYGLNYSVLHAVAPGRESGSPCLAPALVRAAGVSMRRQAAIAGRSPSSATTAVCAEFGGATKRDPHIGRWFSGRLHIHIGKVLECVSQLKASSSSC